jgi:hypothetical protein
VSPTIFRVAGLRFFFFSREEPRVHVHVESASGEAKFWLEPEVELAHNSGLGPRELTIVRAVLQERRHEIREAWNRHFERR